MKIIYKESKHPVTDEDEIFVDIIASCGKRIENIAVIVDPFNENPFIQIMTPLGFAITQTIINNWLDMNIIE